MKNFFGLLWIFLFVSSIQLRSAQQQFRLYGIDQGLCGNFVNNLFQDQKGFLWAGTGNGLCRFDGIKFVNNPTRDSLPMDYVNTSFKDSNGNIWLGHNDGSLSFFDGKKFKIISPADSTISRIVGIAQDKNGRIFAATQRSGVIIVSPNFITEYHKKEFSELTISSLALINEGYFLIGSFDGLYSIEFNDGAFENKQRIETNSKSNIQVIRFNPENNLVYLGTQNDGLRTLRYIDDRIELIEMKLHEELKQINIQDIYLEDNENREIWLSTIGMGAVKLIWKDDEGFEILTIYNSSNGLPSDYVSQILRDFEGNLWIATYGEGLALLNDLTFFVFPPLPAEFGTNVLSIYFNNGLIYLGGENGVISFGVNDPENYNFWGINEGLPGVNITAITGDMDGNLYFGASSRGIYKKPANSNRINLFHISRNSPANIIHFLTIDENILWAATNAGALSFDLPDDQPEIFNTEYGLPHNSIRNIFIDEMKRVWVSTRGNRLFSITNKQHIQVADSELDFSGMIVDKDNRIWASTMGHGVIVIKNDTLLQFTSDEGLINNYAYSMAMDQFGHVWVGHRMGISRINQENYKVRTFGNEIGIYGDCNYNAIQSMPTGEMYFGTTRGLIVYQASLARELPPVKSNITAVYISDQLWDHSQPIKLPYGSYKIRIEFTGISFSNPEKVTYQYKLDGYDMDWSPASRDNFVIYPRLDDGEFNFLLIAYNADGIPTEVPIELKISIKKPIWKQFWFIALMILAAVCMVILIIKIRERAHKIREQYLEEELDKRAKELKVKNLELQRKNNDITDSINYAKRIQGSILPPIHKIEMQFPGSFVFFRPRDIVSGDFYWYDKINESKFLIVCADSTGHGVPGAFMSMIGTTLIKDICLRSNIQSPSEVLNMLDFEIANMLNVQYVIDSEKSTDGMDLTVCEIDLDTMYMRFASAMRPIMLYHKKELIYLRGSRNAIGGQLADSKEFDNRGYQLEKGDIIYMFTDGYPDQFGGPYGKKYKIVRLKSLLADICTLPIERQELLIVNEFDNWKGDEEQVDDVLFMGIKI